MSLDSNSVHTVGSVPIPLADWNTFDPGVAPAVYIHATVWPVELLRQTTSGAALLSRSATAAISQTPANFPMPTDPASACPFKSHATAAPVSVLYQSRSFFPSLFQSTANNCRGSSVSIIGMQVPARDRTERCERPRWRLIRRMTWLLLMDRV